MVKIVFCLIYLLLPPQLLPIFLSLSSSSIDVLLREGCRPEDELEALYFAASARLDLDHPNISSALTSAAVEGSLQRQQQILQTLLEGVRNRVDGTFEEFRSALSLSGWDLTTHHFDSKEFRFSIGSDLEGMHTD